MYRFLIIAIITLMIGPAEIIAQCCSGGVPISGNLGLVSKEKGTLQVQLTYDGNFLRDEFAGTDVQNDFQRDRNRTTQSFLAEISYDISSAFAVSALFTGVIQTREILDENIGERNFIQNQGIGDAIVLAKYRLFVNKPEQASQMVIGFGPKLPLGKIDFRDNQGILLPMDLQPGTGALDLIFWTHFTQNRIIRPTTQLTSILTLRLPGESTHNALQVPYVFGTEFQGQLGISDRFVLGPLMIDPGLMFKFRKVGADKLEGSTFPNTGGEQAFIAPFTSILINPDLSLRFGADFPFYTNMQGRQVATSMRASASVYYNLSRKKNAQLGPVNKAIKF